MVPAGIVSVHFKKIVCLSLKCRILYCITFKQPHSIFILQELSAIVKMEKILLKKEKVLLQKALHS